MKWLLLSIILSSTLTIVAQRADTLRPVQELGTALFVDTLREITVRPDSGGIRLPVSNVLRESLKLQGWAQRYSLDGILQRHAPMLHDQMMHPFGFKERKRIRKKKKVDHVLQQYDAVAADPLQLLLDSVKRAQLQTK